MDDVDVLGLRIALACFNAPSSVLCEAFHKAELLAPYARRRINSKIGFFLTDWTPHRRRTLTSCQSRREPEMSFRHDKSYQFEVGLPDVSMSDWNGPSPYSDAGMMRGLHLASESVLRLATQTHNAVARGDTVGAEVARVSLEKQLALATCLIDELLLNGTDQPTTH